jgi:hypothetical protein
MTRPDPHVIILPFGSKNPRRFTPLMTKVHYEQ